VQRNLTALSEQTFDLLIIGGGIFGAGAARDAAMRGLRVALVEQGDFASGTSSRSSKLIHGGFRYLEQKAFGLVAEASRERRILQTIAPHRVKPLSFLLPVYKGDPRPLWEMRLGMTIYDVLALFRNAGNHHTLGPSQVHTIEPRLETRDLRGAIQFYDCQEDDARFCIDNIMDADRMGAVCANYCQLTGFRTEDDKIVAATVTDRISGNPFEIRAKTFINAAGPWVDRIGQMAPSASSNSRPSLSPTKGVHILLPAITLAHGVFFQGRSDGRMIFILPWNDCSLVGTTDTDFHDDPGKVAADSSDVDYLLARAAEIFPSAHFKPSDVIATVAGVRPLLKSNSADPSSRSREHQLIQTGDNFLSLCGGKYTTYRLVAKQAVDRIYEMLGSKAPACRTGREHIPDFRPPTSGDPIAQSPSVFASDVTHAVQQEMAMSVEDVMWRRTSLMLSKGGGEATARSVTAIIQPLLGWSDEQGNRSVQDYLATRRAGI